MSKKPMISVGQCLAARETILVSTKTSSGEARINTDINKHRMVGKVADRGGDSLIAKALFLIQTRPSDRNGADGERDIRSTRGQKKHAEVVL